MEKKIYAIELVKPWREEQYIRLEEVEIIKETEKQYKVADGYTHTLKKAELENIKKSTYSDKLYGYDKDELIKAMEKMLNSRIEKAEERLTEAMDNKHAFNKFIGGFK